MLISDRSLKPADNKIIVIRIDGDIYVKRVYTRNKKSFILSDNGNHQIDLTDMEIIGVVTCVIHPV